MTKRRSGTYAQRERFVCEPQSGKHKGTRFPLKRSPAGGNRFVASPHQAHTPGRSPAMASASLSVHSHGCGVSCTGQRSVSLVASRRLR
jgi:hypothetical protein